MASLNFNITEQNIEDILIISFEGGINYWCGGVMPHAGDFKGEKCASDALMKGATLMLTDDLGDKKELTKESLKLGIEKYVNEQDSGIIDLETKEIDCCNVDSEVADSIIQLAVFGEIIYG